MKIQSFNMGRGFAPRINASAAIAFAIPSTRLVLVEYMGRGAESKVLKSAIIARPKDNQELCLAMLRRPGQAVQMKQIQNVKAVEEFSRPHCD